MKKRINKKPTLKKKYAIFVDGKTEIWYFQMMKRNRGNSFSFIDIQPQLFKKKKLSDIYQEIIEAKNDYDLVIWIIDLDKIIDDGKKEEFKTYYNNLSKDKKVDIVIINPCLEYWFLLHYEYTDKCFVKCNNAEKSLKKHLPKYDKSEKYFIKSDIYKILEKNLNTAIENSEKLGEFDIHNMKKTVCEMYKFFEVIDKHRI